jgi:DNA-binding transcriptional ArsR family regulator
MADVFEALAAPARRAILDVLSERDGQTLFEICARLTMKHDLTLTRQAISQHLDVLEAAGLLTTRREGRYKYHYLDTTPLNSIVKRWLKPSRKEGKE